MSGYPEGVVAKEATARGRVQTGDTDPCFACKSLAELLLFMRGAVERVETDMPLAEV